jgi:hypothetical protein
MEDSFDENQEFVQKDKFFNNSFKLGFMVGIIVGLIFWAVIFIEIMTLAL